MASPAPYSKPKRRIIQGRSLKFATRKGSYIYATADGHISSKGNTVYIKTDKDFTHRLDKVKRTAHGKVRAGQRIGRATGNSIYYTRLYEKQIVDALPPVYRESKIPSKTWMPEAKVVHASGAPGQMGPGREYVVVWHTSESGNDAKAVYGVAAWVKREQSEYTIIWNPYTGQLLQMFPANVGARAVENAAGLATNRHGRIRIQVCVIGRAANKPLVRSPMKGRRRLMEWLDSWGVPRKFTQNPNNPKRTYRDWVRSGHTTHAACPGNDHTDPGPVNVNRLFAP